MFRQGSWRCNEIVSGEGENLEVLGRCDQFITARPGRQPFHLIVALDQVHLGRRARLRVYVLKQFDSDPFHSDKIGLRSVDEPEFVIQPTISGVQVRARQSHALSSD